MDETSRPGSEGGYYLMGIDWKEKKMGLPVWGWGVGLAGLAYYFFFRKKR